MRLQVPVGMTPRSTHLRPSTSQSQLGHTPENEDNRILNAMISSFHTSATESVLAWPHFDEFPSLRQTYRPIFQLEQLRAPLVTRPSEVTPYLSGDEIRQIIQSFQSSVNFIYPTMTRDKLEAIQTRMMNSNIDYSIESCLALLVMALGCAGQCVSLLFNNPNLGPAEKAWQQSRRGLAEMFFDSVLKRLHVAHLYVSQESTQCLFFIG